MDHTQQGPHDRVKCAAAHCPVVFLRRAARNGVLAALLLLTSGCVSFNSLGTSRPDHGRNNDSEQTSHNAVSPEQRARELIAFSRPEFEHFELPHELPSPEFPEPETETATLSGRRAPERRAPQPDTLPEPSVPEELRFAEVFPARSMPSQPQIPIATEIPESRDITETADSSWPRHTPRSPEGGRFTASLPTPHHDQTAEYDTISGYHDRRPAVGQINSMPLMSPFIETSEFDDRVARPVLPNSETETETETGPEIGSDADTISDTDTDTDTASDADTERTSHTHPADRTTQSIGEPSASSGNPATSDNQPAEETTGEEVVAEVGEEITIVIDGRGWIFAGERNGGTEFELTNRSAEGDTTEFTFETNESGSFVAEFVLQNLTEGTSRRHIAEIRTNPDGEDDPFARLSVPERVPSPADALRENGQQVLVDPEQRLDSQGGTDNGISAGIDGAAFEEGRDPGRDVTRYEPGELESLLEEAVEEENATLAEAVVRELYERDHEIDSETLLLAAQLLERSTQDDGAVTAYHAWLAHFDGEPGSATVHFNLANLYEQHGTTSDILRSSEHYRHVAERYPRSDHAMEAERRARRLRRHFVDVR